MTDLTTVFDYIKSEETSYKTIKIPVQDGWEWNMYDHIRATILYKYGKFLEGAQDNSRPFKNIILPILNLHHRAEGFDVKDIELFVSEIKNYYKSLLIKKKHEPWARANDLDTFIDELVETYCDFGGVLVKDINKTRPEVVPWPRIAFCDQTDILSGPICEKHQYSPDQLLEMESKGWGSKERGASHTIEEIITLAEDQTRNSQSGNQKTKTPGRYIEIYELHGNLPKRWLKDSSEEGDEAPEKGYTPQLQIIGFYTDSQNNRQGVTLFRGKERESIYKFEARDAIFGRALGYGGAEELFQPQIWTNYSEIRKKEMLDSASKTILQYAGDLKGKTKLNEMDNLEVIETDSGLRIEQVNTTPVNIALFERAVLDWQAHAQQTGAANDSIMGKNPTSGTPFKLQELVTAESHSLHEYRKGKIATFVSEIYRDWIIPHLSREISKGDTFLAELDLDELRSVADNLIVCETNKRVVEMILSGETVDDAMVEQFKQETRDTFMKGGNKKFLEIFKEEFKDAPIDVYVNIAGKQKDLAGNVDKITNIFRFIFSNPQGFSQVMQMPGMSKIFNEILEFSGLSPADFYQKPMPPQVGAGDQAAQMMEQAVQGQQIQQNAQVTQ